MTELPAPWRGVLVALFVLNLALTGCLPTPDRQVDEQKEPYYQTGLGRLNGRDYAGAIEAFEKALEVNPRSGLAHLQLGRLFEEHATNNAAAIHHYEKFLQYNPKSDQAQIVRGHIESCKMALAQPYLLTPAAQNAMQRDLDRLSLENNLLRKQVAELKESLARAAAAAAPPPVYVPPTESTPSALRSASSPSLTNPPALVRSAVPSRIDQAEPALPRTTMKSHTVRSGESMFAISRRYRISVDALQSANPGVNPRSLKAGQTLKIPAP